MNIHLRNGVTIQVETWRITWRAINYVLNNWDTKLLTEEEFWSLVELIKMSNIETIKGE